MCFLLAREMQLDDILYEDLFNNLPKKTLYVEGKKIRMALYMIICRAFLNNQYAHFDKDQKTSIVEMCITGYGIMDNSIHSTWKS